MIAEKPTGVDSRLHEMLIERVLFRFDSVQHYTQSLNDLLASLRPKLLERRKRYFDEEARIFASVIAEGQEASIFALGEALDIAHTLLVATNSLLPYSLSAVELGDRKELEERTKKTADILIRGLKVKM